MYFAQFDSFTSARENGKSFLINVETVSGVLHASSPIPMEGLAEVLEELEAVEVGGPIHLWKGPTKELVIVPHSQIQAVKIQFL